MNKIVAILENTLRICKTQYHWSSRMEWPGINQSASATHQPHGICTRTSCFIVWGRGWTKRICRNWSRKDRLTALKSQTMTFKSSDVGEKAVRCHKNEVLAAFTVGFFVMATSNIANLQSRQLSRSAFCYFKLQRIVTYWPLFGNFRCPLLEIQGWPPLRVAKVLKYANAMRIWPLLMSDHSSGGPLLRSFTV